MATGNILSIYARGSKWTWNRKYPIKIWIMKKNLEKGNVLSTVQEEIRKIEVGNIPIRLVWKDKDFKIGNILSMQEIIKSLIILRYKKWNILTICEWEDRSAKSSKWKMIGNIYIYIYAT